MDRAAQDAEALRRALEVAAAAGDDVPVGAVVLGPDGTILGEGTNTRERDGDPTGHAEVNALRAAAARTGRWRLDACTLVVTLEPCTMCAGAAVQARVGRVVYGAVDAKAGAVGSLWDVVRDRRLPHRPEVIGPRDLPADLTAACAEVLVAFFTRRRG